LSNRLPARFDFLRIEADLALTFIGAAKTYSIPENSARAMRNAHAALKQIQHGLANPIGLSTEEIEFLERRCIEIESALRGFRPATED
jgi:cob(I)alamin adenosyltransferase